MDWGIFWKVGNVIGGKQFIECRQVPLADDFEDAINGGDGSHRETRGGKNKKQKRGAHFLRLFTVFCRTAGSYRSLATLRDYSRSIVPPAFGFHVQRRLNRLVCR